MFKKIFSKFEKNLKKGSENLLEVLGKFYFKFEKNLWNFGTNFKKTGTFVISFMKHNIKKELRPKRLLTTNYLRKIIWVLKKIFNHFRKLQENF